LVHVRELLSQPIVNYPADCLLYVRYLNSIAPLRVCIYKALLAEYMDEPWEAGRNIREFRYCQAREGYFDAFAI
jgi:hypothetical protein